MKHTLVARVLDEPGVLNRVASLFRRRAFNIDSLTVGHSEVAHVSRMTIVVDTQRTPASLVAENLRKLVPVLDVQDVTHRRVVARDLALIRVRCEASERSQMADLVAIFRGRCGRARWRWCAGRRRTWTRARPTRTQRTWRSGPTAAARSRPRRGPQQA